MPSRPFAAKWPGECANCHQKYRVGDSVRFPRPGAKELVHDPVCPGVGSSPPAAPSVRREDPGAVPPPAPGPSEPTIYTFHRTVKVWHQGIQTGEFMVGASVKGRTLLAIEIEEVNRKAKEQAKLNAVGEATF